jgi:hypothetical protein
MKIHLLPIMALVTSTSLLGGCPKPIPSNGGAHDNTRLKARRLELGVVHNDSVDWPKQDYADWTFVDLRQTGKLTALLHWDNGDARIQLSLFDVMGGLIQHGRSWGPGSRRAIVVVERPGRHYIRVRPEGKLHASEYALRVDFAPESTSEPWCHDCQVNERRCLGDSSYMVCRRVDAQCNAWKTVVDCAPGLPCQDGTCLGCEDTCPPGTRRCAARGNGYQVCKRASTGCLAWATVNRCGRGKRCRAGRCAPLACRGGTCGGKKQPEQKRTCVDVEARIISLYVYRGRPTLHLEIPQDAGVQAGQKGYVMSAASKQRLPNGEIRILRVIGRFAIALTKLTEVGENRRVTIQVCR